MHVRTYQRIAACLTLATAIAAVKLSDPGVEPVAASSSAAFFNHPVLLEGNCDSPVPGTTLVSPNSCGDFDGDGRIGTAEDTDGADRIFGTLPAALGPGTGAAAGTGANFNGRILIVTSGRFSTSQAPAAPTPIYGLLLTSASVGHIQIEAAPGVGATLDAVFQGDPAGGNNLRQGAPGITVDMPTGSRVILRNLTIRNWATGIEVLNNSQVTVENCQIENNLNYGIRAAGNSRVTVSGSSIVANGFRVGTASNVAAPGAGISAAATAQVNAENSRISDNVIGILAEGTSTVRMSNLTIFNNTTGLSRIGTTSVLASFLNNKIRGNGTDGAPTLNLTNQ
jgi:hypothetical protein